MKSFFAGIAVLMTIATGFAGTYLMDTIEYSAGTGENSAIVVVDFDLDNYFVFSYSWDGAATGWDALSALMTAGDLNIDYTDWGAPWGVFVSDLDYPGGLEYDFGASANVGWAYYGSLDNDIWAGNDGVSARQLTDGAYDSWVWSNYPADWSAPTRLPGQAPVPEPATLALLAVGSLLLRKKK